MAHTQFNVLPNVDSKINDGSVALTWNGCWDKIMTEGNMWLRLKEKHQKVQQMMVVMVTEWNNESVESCWSLHQRVDVPEWRQISTHQTQRWVQSKESKLNKPHRWEIQCRDTFQCRSPQKHRSLLKPQIGADNSPPETWIGADDSNDSDKLRWTQIGSYRHRMQQREDSLAHNLL